MSLPDFTEFYGFQTEPNSRECKFGQDDDPSICVHRTYNSQNANTLSDFGYGWTLQASGTSVTTTVMPDATTPEKPDTHCIGDIVTPITTYGYAAYGDEISQTDANGHATEFTFDALGNQTGRTLPDGESESTTYDGFGRILTDTDFKGQTTAYVYDDSATGDGRMTGEYFFAAGVSALDGSGNVETGNAASDTLYTFDDLGRTATITDSTGVTTDSYDPDGNLIKQVKPEGTINYVYDPATGRLMETWTGGSRSSEGTDTTYAYDPQGRLSTTTVYVLNGVTLSAAQITIDTYDADGNKATELLPNGLLTTYTYNGQDQLTGEAVTKGGTDVFTQQYTLAANGRRDAVNETQYNADGSVFSTVQTTWGYDNLDRLVSEDYTSSVAGQSYADTFSYDLVGNRLTKTHDTSGNDESIAYTYNNDDQLLTETGTLNGSPEYATVYRYDANGSLISKTRTGTSPETETYTYDLQNQLAGSTVNGVTTTYATDAAGDRVSVTTGGTTTTSLVDDNNLTGYSQLLEQSSNGTITTSYIIGDRVLGQGSVGAPSYLVVDGQGSTRLVTDATGAVTARYSFDAFGNALGFTASGAVTSFLYTGQQFDAGLGEYNLRARYYDPSTGTFTSFDPSINGNADPQDLHKYSYSRDNPISAFDPTGWFTQADGYAAEQQIRPIYAKDHPGNTVRYGQWTRLPLFSLFQLKPDIFNTTIKRWLEIKPLSPSGVIDAAVAVGKYSPFAAFGYFPELTYQPSQSVITLPSGKALIFQFGGIIFYTDNTDVAEDLLLTFAALLARKGLSDVPLILEQVSDKLGLAVVSDAAETGVAAVGASDQGELLLDAAVGPLVGLI